MKKLFNFRPIFWVAISAIFAIIVTLSFVSAKWFVYLFFSLVVLGIITLFCFKITRKWFIKHLTFLFSLIFIFVLFVLAFSGFENKHEQDRIQTGKYIVTGTISNVYKNSEYEYTKVTLTNVSLSYKSVTKDVNKDMFLFINTTETNILITENLNDQITFESTVIFYELYDENGKIETRVAPSGASLRSSVYNEYQIEVVKDNSPNFIQKTQLKVREVLFSNMEENNAALNYAMLFGDTNNINLDTKENYSASGIYHLLAVSGLNVGFLALVLTFLLSLFKIKKNIKSIIIAVFIFLYAMLCNFTPSVSRAAIMAIISLYALSRGRQYDGINSLALSMIVILLINPADCFDIGFYLSFAAVFSIIALTPSISAFFEKFLTKNISTTIAMTISAQLGTIPIVIKYFEKMTLYGIFSNLLAVPLASIGFMSLFIITPIATILPFMGFLLVVPEFFIYVITIIANAFAMINFAVIDVKYSAVAAVIFYVGLIIWSDFVFVKQKWSKVVPLLLTSVAIILTLF